MILVIDNYDSFVFNLARYLTELGVESRVVRNDAISLEEIRQLAPKAILLSPGPGTPDDAGICVPLVQELGGAFPILGVCLGCQALGAAFGAEIIRAPKPVHGQVSEIRHDESPLFRGIKSPFRATRYHSLIIEESTLVSSLQVTAHNEENLPMAVAHRDRPLYGVQFHPESVLTEFGHRLLSNFLRLAGIEHSPPQRERVGSHTAATTFHYPPPGLLPRLG